MDEIGIKLFFMTKRTRNGFFSSGAIATLVVTLILVSSVVAFFYN
jgi:hypothetical protein